jgi:hypothetical protein
MLGPAVAGAIGGAVGGALTGALRNPPKGRKKNPSLALVGLGLPNPAGRRHKNSDREIRELERDYLESNHDPVAHEKWLRAKARAGQITYSERAILGNIDRNRMAAQAGKVLSDLASGVAYGAKLRLRVVNRKTPIVGTVVLTPGYFVGESLSIQTSKTRSVTISQTGGGWWRLLAPSDSAVTAAGGMIVGAEVLSGRAKNPALALVGLGLPNPPRAQNPTNHACAKDRGYRGEISLEEARRRARETGKLAEFEKSIKYYRATHGKAPTSVAVYAYDDGSRQKRVSFGVVFGKSDQIFYEDTPDGKKRNRDGSNKKWVHETSRKAPPSLVWFADTGLLGYVGGALHVNSSGRDAGWLLD